MEMKKCLLVCTIFIGTVVSYPTSVPEGACESMTPGHGYSAQKGPSPYKIEVSPKILKQGERVQIILSGNIPFKGFYLQGRTPEGTPIGTFEKSSSNNSSSNKKVKNSIVVKTHSCGKGKDNAAFHGVRGLKNDLEIFWRAPTDYSGQVIFTSSFVSEFEQFWTFVKATPITVKKVKVRTRRSRNVIFKDSPYFIEEDNISTKSILTPPEPRIMFKKLQNSHFKQSNILTHLHKEFPEVSTNNERRNQNDGMRRKKSIWIMASDNRFENFKDVDEIIDDNGNMIMKPKRDQYQYQNHKNIVGNHHHENINFNVHRNNFLSNHHINNNYKSKVFRQNTQNFPYNNQKKFVSSDLKHQLAKFPTHGYLVHNVKSHLNGQPPFYIIPANKHDIDNLGGQYYNNFKSF